MKKQILLLAMMLLPMVAGAQGVVEIDGIYYDLASKAKEAIVTKKPSGNYTGNVVIPASVTYGEVEYSVTSIGNEAFNNCGGLTSVTIGNNVTSIGESAFSNCSGLTSVHISDIAAWCKISFSGYESNPLYYAHKLYLGEEEIKDLVIPNSVTSIESYAFDGCSGLTSVTIPNSVTGIEWYAFYGCSGLTSVTIPNSVTSIGSHAFQNCRCLASVTIPNSVTSIGGDAFFNCSSLNTIKVPVTDYTAFCSNKVLGLIYSRIEKPVQLIDSEGKEITEYIVPAGVTSIGSNAFLNCTGLTAITITESVTSIGSYAFSGCNNLNSVTVPVTDYSTFCTNKALGCIYSSLGKPVQLIDSEGKEITEYIVPDGVTSIGSNAFLNCTGLTAITIAGSVKSIGWHAFSGCSGLTSVTIPGSVTGIGSDAFSGCTSIMSVKSYIAEPFNVTGLFSNETYRQGTLYVPAGTKDLYIRFDGWREFLKIEEMTVEPAPNGVCATPRIYVVGKKFVYECETPDAEFESILSTEEEKSKGNEFVVENKTIKYTLTVYATAEGYDRSEPAKISFVIDRNDVNQDGMVDVADISAIIYRMAEKARIHEGIEE